MVSLKVSLFLLLGHFTSLAFSVSGSDDYNRLMNTVQQLSQRVDELSAKLTQQTSEVAAVYKDIVNIQAMDGKYCFHLCWKLTAFITILLEKIFLKAYQIAYLCVYVQLELTQTTKTPSI